MLNRIQVGPNCDSPDAAKCTLELFQVTARYNVFDRSLILTDRTVTGIPSFR